MSADCILKHLICVFESVWLDIVGINQDGESNNSGDDFIVCLGRGLIYSEGPNVSCSYSIP